MLMGECCTILSAYTIETWDQVWQQAKFSTLLNLSKSISFNPIPDDKILDWSKLKQIAGDILKCI